MSIILSVKACLVMLKVSAKQISKGETFLYAMKNVNSDEAFSQFYPNFNISKSLQPIPTKKKLKKLKPRIFVLGEVAFVSHSKVVGRLIQILH